MKTNYHTHTKYCKHAAGTAEDYVKSAIQAGLDILGFSDHGPFPDDLGYRMDYAFVDQYIAEINGLKSAYKDKIKILNGFEIEYLPQYHKYYEELLNKNGVDYLILGEHFFFNSQKDIINIYDIPDQESLIDYANSAVEGMRTGYFKYLAHPDLMFIQDLPDNKYLLEASDIIINAALKYNFVLEVNANGFRKGRENFLDGERYPYPHDSFWKKVSRTEVKTIVGSDCHAPDFIYDKYVEMAYEYGKELKLNLITEL